MAKPPWKDPRLEEGLYHVDLAKRRERAAKEQGFWWGVVTMLFVQGVGTLLLTALR